MRIETLGGLRTRIVGGTDREGGGRGPLVILMHGFGAPGDDLVALHRVLSAPPGTRFAFPEALLDLGPAGGGGRAWWPIDMVRLQISMQRGEVRDLSKEPPPGIDAARERALALVAEATGKLEPSHLVLGGFSQGSMLAIDVALRSEVPLAGLIVWSGTLLSESEWIPLMAKRSGLPVLQSHGHEDPILPFSGAERLRDAMVAAGMRVRFVPFRGGHGIPPQVVDATSELLNGLAETST